MSEDLKAYLGDRQNDAALIEGLLAAAMACISTGRHAMVLDLIDNAHDVAKQRTMVWTAPACRKAVKHEP